MFNKFPSLLTEHPQVNKNQKNVSKEIENTKQINKNKEEEVTGRTRRRRSALTT